MKADSGNITIARQRLYIRKQSGCEQNACKTLPFSIPSMHFSVIKSVIPQSQHCDHESSSLPAIIRVGPVRFLNGALIILVILVDAAAAGREE